MYISTNVEIARRRRVMGNVRQDANAQVTRENNAMPKSKELLQPEIGTPNASGGVLLYQHSALRIM